MILLTIIQTRKAFAHQDIEGEPVSKRRRVDDVFHPSTLTLRPDVLSFGDEVPPEQHDVWKRIFQDAHRLAPRVGNRKIQLDDPTFIAFREINPQIQWTHLFVCRGTERFQVPLDSPSTSEADVRHTWCLHRQTLKLLDMGEDNWSNLTRAQKIRASVPSRLTLTAFGRRSDSLAERAPRSHESHEHERPPAGTPDEEQTFRDVPAVDPRYTDRHIAVPQSEQELGKQISIPEGWAPPPTPIHGPAFRRLSSVQKQELVKLHKNLGHPDPIKLKAHLIAQKADPAIIEAALEYACDACLESIQVKHQRPGKLHDPKDFNDVISGFRWHFLERSGGFPSVYDSLCR